MKRKILSLSVLTILLSAVGFSQNIESTNQNEDSLIAAFQEFDEVCIPLNYKEMYFWKTHDSGEKSNDIQKRYW